MRHGLHAGWPTYTATWNIEIVQSVHVLISTASSHRGSPKSTWCFTRLEVDDGRVYRAESALWRLVDDGLHILAKHIARYVPGLLDIRQHWHEVLERGARDRGQDPGREWSRNFRIISEMPNLPACSARALVLLVGLNISAVASIKRQKVITVFRTWMSTWSARNVNSESDCFGVQITYEGEG